MQPQEHSDETDDKTISGPTSKTPKTMSGLKSIEGASSEIGVSSKENIPISAPAAGTTADPAGNLSQSSAIPVSNHGAVTPRYVCIASGLLKLLFTGHLQRF